MAVYTIAEQVEVKPAASWVTVAHRNVIDVRGSLQLTGSSTNAFAFGDNSDAKCDLELAMSALTTIPDLMPVRVTFTRNATTKRRFVGLCQEHSRDLKAGTRQLSCIGLAELVRTTKAYSPLFYRRPAATQTSAASVEDPANGAYRAGLINWLLWQAGGRPAEQDFTYPNAVFYYSCEQAIITPDWSWVAGASAWDEALKVARASGGQLYQDADGTIRYRQPLSFADGTAVYTFTPSVYTNLRERTAQQEVVTQVICPFLPRYVHPIQEIVNDTTLRPIEPSATDTRDFDPQWPLYDVEQASAGQLIVSGQNAAIKATFYNGDTVEPTDFTHTLTVRAQKITLAITNTSGAPFYVTRILMRGRPVAAGVAGTTTTGSGTIQRNIEDNPYIQSRSHAERLGLLTLAFYGASRPLRNLEECPYDPDRTVGETVNVQSEWWAGDVPHVIVTHNHEDTGAKASYDVVSVAGLPRTSEFYLCGSIAYNSQTKKLGY